ncbi:MAG: HEPN domain-containing protein [Planctomycetes bacterium]|nr:HEPN domain-containing protein [Planctomycetota bacterium]
MKNGRRRVEVERLIRQARADLKVAEDNLGIDHFDVAAFYSHQSVEKGLKALFIHLRRKAPPFTHDLVELGRALSAPAALATDLADLTREYTTARYPDAANAVPAEMYTKDIARRAIDAARRLWKWIEPRF